ncbi:hypothetical protein [Algoriphagus sp.]|uniref:hypothetical protein n=1 Tax=Algoriphagus sp. TaxID=1872435 RepID=UPI003919CFDB
MRRFYFLLIFILISSCEDLFDVKREKGPCTIQLANGGTITTQEDIEILQATGTITYRDDEGKLWSIPADEYSSYSCGN